MAAYVGSNGRLDRRWSKGRAIGLTILAVTMVGLIIVGQANLRALIAYAFM